jgi:hypothetical protein
VDVLGIPGWHAEKNSVDFMVEKMKLAMEGCKPDIVILHCIDENIFLTLAEDGTWHAAKSDIEGKMHVEGQLTTASEETFQILLKLMETISKATEGFYTIVVLLTLRYDSVGCCRDKDHLTNRMEPDFVNNIRKELDVVRLGIKRFLNSSSREGIPGNGPQW